MWHFHPRFDQNVKSAEMWTRNKQNLNQTNCTTKTHYKQMVVSKHGAQSFSWYIYDVFNVKTTAASDVLIVMLIDPNARRRSYATKDAIAVSSTAYASRTLLLSYNHSKKREKKNFTCRFVYFLFKWFVLKWKRKKVQCLTFITLGYFVCYLFQIFSFDRMNERKKTNRNLTSNNNEPTLNVLLLVVRLGIFSFVSWGKNIFSSRNERWFFSYFDFTVQANWLTIGKRRNVNFVVFDTPLSDFPGFHRILFTSR